MTENYVCTCDIFSVLALEEYELETTTSKNR